MGMDVLEQQLPRESLYMADEIFLTGTASEVTPVRSIDRITVGSGRRGPVTQRLQQAFLDLVRGRSDDAHGWLTHVSAERASRA
jgi:branched-chain amino acid aminotransferase